MTTATLLETEVSPQPLYNIAIGFAASQTLFSAHRLGVFEALHEREDTATGMAARLSCDTGALEILLNTCVSLQLCRKTDGRFSNSELAARYLVAGQDGYLGKFMDHFHDHMLPAWRHLEDAIKTGHAQVQKVIGKTDDHFFNAIDREERDLETFMETMEEHSLLEGAALARAYDFSRHKQLVDVAGGTGAMSVTLIKAWPHLRSTVFDRPPVGRIAEKRIRQHGLADKITVQTGSFFEDSLPTGADVMMLSGILHNWSAVNARRILSSCAKAAAPGTVLLISEQTLSADKTAPLVGTLCSLNMLIMMEGGQEYSTEEFRAMLSETGWRLEEVRPTRAVRQLLIAVRV